MSASLDAYERWMRGRDDKPRSIANVLHALRPLFGDAGELATDSITPARARALYERYRETPTRLGEAPTAATHRHTLRLAKTLGGWWVDHGWARRNPFAGVAPVGKARRGKAQLRATEARALTVKARDLVGAGDYRYLAPLVALYLGLRSVEIVGLVSRDVDDAGRLLWVPRDVTKSDAGERSLTVEPAWLAALLHARAREVAPERLFPHRSAWVSEQVVRLCELVEVPRVTAHGLRGTHSSLAERHGATSRAVADALGHVDVGTAGAHYTAPGVREDAARRRALRVLEGGRR